MSIYAYHAFYAASCFVHAYPIYGFGLNLNPTSLLATEEPIKVYVNSQAIAMGLTKQIVVLQGQDNWACGNNFFSGKAFIQVAEQADENVRKFNATRQLAHIRNSHHFTAFGVALAANLFTALVVAAKRNLVDGYLAGIIVGGVLIAVLGARADKRADLAALQHCSKEVNQAALDKLVQIRKEGAHLGLFNWFFSVLEPSLDERIGYFYAHIHSQKV